MTEVSSPTEAVWLSEWMPSMSSLSALCVGRINAQVTWPTGRTTIETIAGNAMAPDLVVTTAPQILAHYEKNLTDSLIALADEMRRTGLIIRSRWKGDRLRRKARHVQRFTWVK
jgi:hypothetical protein